MSKRKRNVYFTLIVAAVSVLCPLIVNAVLIGNYPGLQKLIDMSDAIVILRIDSAATCGMSPSLYMTYDCYIYQTLKGNIPKNTRIKLQLMDTNVNFVTPYGCMSTHLMFLIKKQNADEPTEYRTLGFQGANVRLSPFGNEKTPKGSTLEEQIRNLIKDSIEYWSKEQDKERKFLEMMLGGSQNSISDTNSDPNSSQNIAELRKWQEDFERMRVDLNKLNGILVKGDPNIVLEAHPETIIETEPNIVKGFPFIFKISLKGRSYVSGFNLFDENFDIALIFRAKPTNKLFIIRSRGPTIEEAYFDKTMGIRIQRERGLSQIIMSQKDNRAMLFDLSSLNPYYYHSVNMNSIPQGEYSVYVILFDDSRTLWKVSNTIPVRIIEPTDSEHKYLAKAVGGNKWSEILKKNLRISKSDINNITEDARKQIEFHLILSDILSSNQYLTDIGRDCRGGNSSTTGSFIIIRDGKIVARGDTMEPRGGFYSIGLGKKKKHYPIPSGIYDARKGTFKGRYPNVEIDDVPGFNNIEIHRGNSVKDTTGCILVGTLNKKGDKLSDSKKSLEQITNNIKDNDEVKVEISDKDCQKKE